MNNQQLLHSRNLGVLNGDLSIVFAIDHKAVDPVDGPVTGNHTQFKFYRPQDVGCRILGCSQLRSSWAVRLLSC